MELFPVFMNLANQHCLVVGGGSVALRKAELLLQAGARVTVVAPEIQPGIYALNPPPTCIKRIFTPEDLADMTLAIVATSVKKVNEAVSRLAKARNIPVNVVDNPALCSFIVPAIVDRSPIIVAVSSSGAAPVLARLTRARIESILPQALGKLAQLARKYRQSVKDRFETNTERRRFWEQIFEGAVADKVYSGQADAAEKSIKYMLADENLNISRRGDVALIGAGPGDPELMTFKAVRLLQRADVVIYDRLIPKQILDLARRDAQQIYAGKEVSKHTIPQAEINKLLIELAQEGKRVVRLKGGDPFIFGRGGEEIGELMQFGISFQVVPGITSASGCSTYSGIPLTHRDYAQSVLFVTGHLQDNSVNLDWKALAQPNQTAVIYMGMLGIKTITAKIIEHGLAPKTPVAVIYKGTTPEQKIVIGDLTNIAAKVDEAGLSSPGLIIIGEVVRLHAQLNWYGDLAAACVS